MSSLTKAKIVPLLRAAIAVALCALVMSPRVKSQEDSRYTVLAIAYFGALDHPIPQIVISDSYGGAESYRNEMMKKEQGELWDLAHLRVVSSPVLAKLIATVKSDKNGVQQEPEHPYNGGSMTIVAARTRKTLFFHVEPAMTLVDLLGEFCKSDKSLRSDLLEFKAWIRMWGDNPPPRPVPRDTR